jgi:amidohydrolase
MGISMPQINDSTALSRRTTLMGLCGVGTFGIMGLPALADEALTARIRTLAANIQPKVVSWRRDFHEHPELSNREFNTSKKVATELKRLGLEVRTMAKTGVVGVLKGGKPGPAVALRADMDGLPVEEKTGQPFASKAMGEYEGNKVPIAHACGHDSHTAMLLGAAEVLTAIKADIAGSVVFIFQPAEEGKPGGETGGAALMVAEGALDNPKVQSIFGIHVWPEAAGTLSFRPEGFMAAADRIEIKLKGAQTHGAQPWKGIDMTALASDCVQAINQVTARQLDPREPTVITIATMHGGARFNIIPENFVLGGTMRTFSVARRKDAIEKVTRVIKAQAQAYGAEADIKFEPFAPLTFNDPALTSYLTPTLTSSVGAKAVNDKAIPITASEDFSEFQAKVPGLYCFLGIVPPGQDPATAPPNHSPYFDIYEPAMEVGVRTHALVALAMLARNA